MPAELLTIDFSGRFRQEWLDLVAGGDFWTAEVQLIEAPAKRVHGVHFQPLADARFITDQASEFGSQGIRQGIGKGAKQHPGIGVSTGQKDSPVQGHDSLASAGRTRHPCGSAIVSFHDLALRRMEKDSPFLPGIGEGAFQFVDIMHHPEAALGIGVIERISTHGRGWRDLRLATSGEFQQGLSGLTRQVVG